MRGDDGNGEVNMAKMHATLTLRAGLGLAALDHAYGIMRAMLAFIPEWNALERKKIKREMRRLRRELDFLRIIEDNP